MEAKDHTLETDAGCHRGVIGLSYQRRQVKWMYKKQQTRMKTAVIATSTYSGGLAEVMPAHAHHSRISNS
jgi:hypothetical protein